MTPHKAERTEPRDYRMRVRRKFQPIVIVRTDKAPGDLIMTGKAVLEVGRG